MNRAQRRKSGVEAKNIPILAVTSQQMKDTFRDYVQGDIVTIAGRMWKDGAAQKCESGEETPFCLRVIQ